MASGAGTIEQLALVLGRALAPLEHRLQTGDVLGLFEELGLRFPPALLAQAGFTNALATAANSAQALPPAHYAADRCDRRRGHRPDRFGGAADRQRDQGSRRVTETVANDLQALDGTLGLGPGDVTNFATGLVDALLGYLVVGYLEGYHPIMLGMLSSPA